jgi:hypothetical protein
VPPLADHVTAWLAVPLTSALSSNVSSGKTVACVGQSETCTGVSVTVTGTAAVSPGSAVLVATT